MSGTISIIKKTNIKHIKALQRFQLTHSPVEHMAGHPPHFQMMIRSV
jgi:hypothetical protein